MVRHGRRGMAGLGRASPGRDWQGKAGKARQRRGGVRRGRAWPG